MDYVAPTLISLGTVNTVVLGTDPVLPIDCPDGPLGHVPELHAGLDD